MKKHILVFYFLTAAAGVAAQGDYPIRPVKFSEVKIADSFWTPRMETNRKVTIPFAFAKSESTGRICNFEEAGKVNRGEIKTGKFCSKYGYDDSDVVKIIEGASYSLANHYDAALDAYLDTLISKIAAAQEPDGYLYTMRTINPERSWASTRWVNARTRGSHELYNVGHMYEAAVAHYQATGKKTFLTVAEKNADLLCRTFGPYKRSVVPGHQEIEIGLAKLYRVTGKREYLDLAKFFLDERGKGENKGGAYNQDHMPVVEQEEAVGHAVRAVYMYSAMADIAALTGDKEYIRAIDRIWENVTSKKLYITGGIGSDGSHEAFGANYDLPNLTAYNETCAAIANVFWNQRMFLLHGESKYIDVLEQSLYNNVISGVSLGGNTFFYPNPLASDGEYERSEWFDCSCCPSNITRFLASLGGYIYAVKSDSVFVNLYVAGTGTIQLGEGASVSLEQETGYPWNGRIRITVKTASPGEFPIFFRIPGWLGKAPLPGGLYHFTDDRTLAPKISLNSRPQKFRTENGYALLQRKWHDGDVVELEFPMEVRRVQASPEVSDDRGRVCLTRGPLVFCAEGVDNGGEVGNILLPDTARFRVVPGTDVLKGILTLEGSTLKLTGDGFEQPVARVAGPFRAIPYYAWCHRGAGPMNVWFYSPEKVFEPVMQPAGSLFTDGIMVALKQYEEQETWFSYGDEYPGKESNRYTGPFRITETVTLNAKSFRGERESELVAAGFTKTNVLPAHPVTKAIPGIRYSYYEGRLRKLPAYDTLKALKTGILPNFDILTPRDTADFYALRFMGLIFIPADGVYTFYSNSDDGSRILIRGEQILVNDGLHEPIEKQGQMALGKGFHPVVVEYFEYGSGELLEISMEGSEMKKQAIPDSLLFHEE